MKKEDKDRIVRLYEGRYGSMGYNIATVGWGNREQQTLRFKVLTERFDLNGRSVCDIGCGFGDLYAYLKKHHRTIMYTGIDLAPGLIAEARKRHPDGEFLAADILDRHFKRRFDYCFLSGALTFRISDNIKNAKEVIRKMFSMSRRAAAFNMLSTYVDFKKRINFHYSPEEFFKFAKGLSRYVALRHDYPLWDFTIYILKKYED